MRETRKIAWFISSVILTKTLVLSGIAALILIALSLSVVIPVIAQTPATRSVGKIAFRCDGDICVINADGTNQIRLTNNPLTDSSPAWSPDGNRIAFSSYHLHGYSEIYVMNADGSNQTRLTYNSAQDLAPDWSPDGSKLVFERHGASLSASGIYVINADGTGEVRLSGIWTADRFPDWSPDGNQIAFVDHRSICLMNADGSNRVRLVEGDSSRGYFEPAWSPDGARILFSSHPINDDEPGGPDEIYVVNAGGGILTNLTNSQASLASMPAWSPDGTQLTFMSYHSGEVSIYTMKLDGSGLMNVAQGTEPAWGSASAQCTGACWTSTGNLNTSRFGHTATVLPNGKVLVAGGHSSADRKGILNSAELYDPATGTWSLTGSLNVPRYHSTATLLPNGKVLVAGGISNPSSVTATAELYDPATGTWSLTGDLTTTRFEHSATLLRNGKVLIAGGHGGQDGPHHSAELYDPASGTWSVTGRLLNTGGAGRVMHTATLLQNGKVLVAGGIDGDDFEVSFSSAELYNPDTGTWSVAGSLSTTRAPHTATLLQNGKVLVVGGSNLLDSAELYDPATDTWSHAGTLSRYGYHTATLLPRGQVLIAGGAKLSNGSGLISVDSADLYDPQTGVWSNTASLNTARYSHTATPLQNGKVLIVGGFNRTVGMLNSAELYDPGTTSTTNPIDDPQFFVRQHYLDFLGREPEQAGLDGWLNVLNNCGVTVAPPCDRIEVSAGFFRSPEFQARGYFIYRFYSSVGRIPLHHEFMPDFAKVSGFLSDAQLEANKADFVNEYMARAEFQTKYSSTFGNPTAYVDALLQTVGLPNHPSRTMWINQLNANNTSQTRGEVLRALVERQEVYDKYYNEAFVIMQYFGYLRRTADAAYLDWIQTMNQTGGDYRIMINGFMNSAEYRRRFGP